MVVQGTYNPADETAIPFSDGAGEIVENLLGLAYGNGKLATGFYDSYLEV